MFAYKILHKLKPSLNFKTGRNKPKKKKVWWEVYYKLLLWMAWTMLKFFFICMLLFHQHPHLFVLCSLLHICWFLVLLCHISNAWTLTLNISTEYLAYSVYITKFQKPLYGKCPLGQTLTNKHTAIANVTLRNYYKHAAIANVTLRNLQV